MFPIETKAIYRKNQKFYISPSAIEKMASKSRQKPHALLLPYPLQGHVIPFVHLAIKLASRGFTITFVNTESIHHQISKSQQSRPDKQRREEEEDIFSGARESSPDLDIRYTTINDGFPIEFDRSLNHDQFFESILHDFHAGVDKLVGELVLSHDPPLNSFIVDTFYVFGSLISEKHNLLYTSFFTEPALVFTLYYHMDLLRKNSHFDNHEKRKDTIKYIPGVEEIKPTDLTSYLQTDPTTVVHEIIGRGFEDVKKADFVICNTVQELEPGTISALQENQPFYAVGPIFPSDFPKSPVATSMWSESDCSLWLDGKPKGSVLYISFGSYAHTTKDEILEIANALLLLRDLNFIWVLRPDIVSSDETADFLLPDGYENLVRGRGLIVPWCFQIAVISHPAVGGFLTHCGWNSILESVWCSVPLICFPLLTDQFTNRKLVVDDWKIGIDLRREDKSITREDVAGKISRLMSGKSSDDLKLAVKKVRKYLENALAIDGSSQKNLGQFVDDLTIKINNPSIYGAYH